MHDIAKYDPNQARDERGRWSRASGAAALRTLAIAAETAQLRNRVTAAAAAPWPDAIVHAYMALHHGQAILEHLRALRHEGKELGRATVVKLRQVRDALMRLKARLSAEGAPA
jgi:hypothetical protein